MISWGLYFTVSPNSSPIQTCSITSTGNSPCRAYLHSLDPIQVLIISYWASSSGWILFGIGSFNSSLENKLGLEGSNEKDVFQYSIVRLLRMDLIIYNNNFGVSFITKLVIGKKTFLWRMWEICWVWYGIHMLEAWMVRFNWRTGERTLEKNMENSEKKLTCTNTPFLGTYIP